MSRYLDAIRFNLPCLSEREVKQYYRRSQKTPEGRRTLELLLWSFQSQARRSFYDD